MIRPIEWLSSDGSRHHVRGRVVVRRSGPRPEVALRLRDDEVEVRLVAEDIRPLLRVEGAGVVAFGTLHLDVCRLRVDRFVVVSMNGAPAVDGILTGDGERLVLETEDGGELPIPYPPPGLREHVGDRIWLAGQDLGERLESFGFIERAL